MRNIIDLVSSYPTTLYHAAPSSERENILMIGLQAEGDGIFFEEHIPDRKPGIDVWEVDARGLPIYNENGGWLDWTNTVIPPSRLNLLSDRIDENTIVPIMEAWFGPALLWRNAMTKWLETYQSDAHCHFEMSGSDHVYIENVGQAELMKQMCDLADRYAIVLIASLDGKRKKAVDRYVNYGFDVKPDDNTVVREPQNTPDHPEPLVEAPIEDISHIGDWNKSSSFNHEQDRKLLTNPKAISKIKSMWRYPEEVLYKIVLVNHPDGRPATGNQEVGIVDENWLKERMPRTADEILQVMRGDCVNIIYTNNSGTGRMPLTGWVLAHRFGHALQASRGSNESYYWKDATDTFIRYIEPIAKDYNLPTRGTSRAISDNIQFGRSNSRRALMNAICTFRSARENKIIRPYEAIYELFAQYITTGSIRFNALPQTIKWGPTTFSYQHLDNIDQDSRNLEDLAYELEQYFATAIHYAVGNILVM